jgi:hypothetical protein
MCLYTDASADAIIIKGKQMLQLVSDQGINLVALCGFTSSLELMLATVGICA